MAREYPQSSCDPEHSPAGWADREARDARNQIIRLQHEVEQRDAQVAELFGRVQKLEGVLEGLTADLERAHAVHGILERLEEHVLRLQDAQVSADQRVEEVSRRWQEEAERSRQIQNDLIKTVNQLDRAVQAWNSKVESLEEGNRRLQELLAHQEERLDGNERQLESLETRSARAVEASKRADQEFSRMTVELDALRLQDDALGERLQLFNEWLRHAESQMTALQEQVRTRQDIMDKLELHRVERQRLEDRLNEVESFAETMRERMEEQHRLMALLDGKGQSLQNRFNNLQEQMDAQRHQLMEHFTRVAQSQERQKRRQMEDLEREIRELQSYGFWPTDK